MAKERAGDRLGLRVIVSRLDLYTINIRLKRSGDYVSRIDPRLFTRIPVLLKGGLDKLRASGKL